MNPDDYKLMFKGQEITTVTMFKIGDEYIAAPSIVHAVEQYRIGKEDAGDYGSLIVNDKWKVIYSPDSIEVISIS